MKTWMFKAFVEQGNYNWIDFIKDLVKSYNNSYHRSIKMTPNQVNPSTEATVRKNLYPKTTTPVKKAKYKVGDRVRISRLDNVFRKGYMITRTWEIFEVSEVQKTDPITYKLKDLSGDPLYGSFYDSELTFVDKSDEIYAVEKIVNKRKRGGKTEYRVKYMGWDSSHNQWISEDDLYRK